MMDQCWSELEKLIQLIWQDQEGLGSRRWEWAQERSPLARAPQNALGVLVWLCELCIDPVLPQSAACDETPLFGWVAPLMVEDIGRVYRLCCAATLERVEPGDPWVRIRRARGVQTHAERDRPKPRYKRVSYRTGRSSQEDRLWSDPEYRRSYAAVVGGRVTGRAVRGITCPNCERKSVYYYVYSGKDRSARCNHRSSCGWYGALIELGGRA